MALICNSTLPESLTERREHPRRYCLQTPNKAYAPLYASVKAKKALLLSAIDVMKSKPMLTTVQVARQAVSAGAKKWTAQGSEDELVGFVDSHLLAWLMVCLVVG